MTFVVVYKARRRPSWQDKRPKTKAQRNLYAVADRAVPKMSRAFARVGQAFSEALDYKSLEDALRRGESPESILQTLPFLDSPLPGVDELWAGFAQDAAEIYDQVVSASGQQALDESGIKMKFEVQKADKEVPVVPPNPFSIKWIRRAAGSLVRLISGEQRQLIRQIILRGYERGLRAEAMVDAIRSSIGLLPRDEGAVQRIIDTMQEAGASKAAIDAAAEKKRKKLLEARAERIARTEVIAAANQGRTDAWRAAQHLGELPANVVREWNAASASDKACKICLGLHGEKVPLGQPFYSQVLGRHIDAPPAHPSCRCTLFVSEAES